MLKTIFLFKKCNLKNPTFFDGKRSNNASSTDFKINDNKTLMVCV